MTKFRFDNKEIEQMRELLAKFVQLEDQRGSLYGRKMDVAMASDMRSILLAYRQPVNN